MKKAFTLSEALVTLAIIGVLAAILIPVVSNVRPDKDKITYKKALYTMQNAISNAMDDPTTYSMAANSSKYWQNADFCNSIAETLNVTGKVICSEDAGDYEHCPDGSGDSSIVSCYSSPNFTTTDGIRYWGLEKKFTDSDPEHTIYIDRKISDSELRALTKFRGDDGRGLKIKVRYDGRVTTNEGYENELIDDGFSVQQRDPNKEH